MIKYNKINKNEETDVSKYINKKGPKLSKGIKQTLDIWAKKLSKRVSQEYSKVFKASESDDELVERILAAINLEGMSIDMMDEITPDLVNAFKNAGIASLERINFDVSDSIVQHMDQAAKYYAELRAGELITDFAGTNAEFIRDVVTNAIVEGMSSQELADNIMESGAFGEYRAEMIARTELAYAHVEGNLQGWKESGVVGQKQWYTAPGCCDLCDEIDGEIVELDADFSTGDNGPPLHPNCRCTVLPVLLDEPEIDGAEG